MEIRPRVIRAELMSCLSAVDLQESELRRHATAMGIDPYKMRDANGGWAMPEVLHSKALLLHSLTMINTKES
jgi:hypothetical protein